MLSDADKYRGRSIRLPGYDYAQAGAYFVTICTRDRELFFNHAVMRAIAEQCWIAIPRHVPVVELDEWIVMPDHIHGILVVSDGGASADDDTYRRNIQLPAPTLVAHSNANAGEDERRRGVQLNAPTKKFDDTSCCGVGENAARGQRNLNNPHSVVSPYRNTLSVIVRTYKAAVTTLCRREGHAEFGWQRNYYDRVIRAEADLNQIRQYITNNPRV